jgi:phosphate-selective porin OprO/OprP
MGRKLAVLVCLLAPGLAAAQEVDLRSVLQRLDELERQNQELRQTVDELRRQLPPAAPPTADALPDQTDPATQKIQGIIKDYLRDEADRKQEEEDRKAREAEAVGHEVGSDLTMTVDWRDGFQLHSPHRDFRVHFGGRLQADGGWFDPDAALDRAFPDGWLDGADFRRIRIRSDGTVWEVIDFVLEMEFSQGIQGLARHPFPTDVYVGFRPLPLLGNLAVGHFKEPFSLQDYGTPDSFGVFMERGADDAFTPDRNLGVMWHDAYFSDTLAVAAGIFRANSDKFSGNAFDYGDGEYAYTMRLAFMPYYANDGRCWLLVGPAYSRRHLDPDDRGITDEGIGASRARFQIRPPIRVNSPVLADTGELRADHFDLFNVQLGLNLGSLLFETEYYRAHVHNIRRGAFGPGAPRLLAADFHGFYASLSYFLTGEYHGLDRKLGRKLRVQPDERWFLVRRGEPGSRQGLCCGWGAWEVAARYSWVDLTSPALGAFPGGPGFPAGAVAAVETAGIEQDVTLSLSCYLNPQLRIQANYAHAWRNVARPAESGSVDLFGMRLWFDF